jgi:uncharacterized protein (DUF4213/DUF364 family)
MANRWYIYDELLESVPETALVRSFVSGRHWLMVESDGGGVGLAQRLPLELVPSGGPTPGFDPVGRPLKLVAERLKAWDFYQASAGLAALNAANNTLALIEGSPLRLAVDENRGDAFDFFLSEISGKKVAVIGHFPKLSKLRDKCELSILERQPQPGDLPDQAAEYILPEQDFVYITGTAFINKTITRLLELSQRATVCLVGPSTPMNPLLFKHGLASLSGLVVTDRQKAAEALTGDRCADLFSRGGLKVNLVAEGRR